MSEHILRLSDVDVERQKLKVFQAGYKDGLNQVHPQPHNYPSYTKNYKVGWDAGNRKAHQRGT